MKLRIDLEEKMQDVRLRDRLIAEWKMAKEEIKKYLDKLPDDAQNAEVIETEKDSNLH